MYLLWDLNGPDIAGRQHLLLTTHQLFQKIDRDIIIWWEKNSYICTEKVVALALAPVLGREQLG